jgi:hypothetical protein
MSGSGTRITEFTFTADGKATGKVLSHGGGATCANSNDDAYLTEFLDSLGSELLGEGPTNEASEGAIPKNVPAMPVKKPINSYDEPSTKVKTKPKQQGIGLGFGT